MANHCRMYTSILIIFAVSYSWALSEQPTNFIAWTGEKVELHCGNNPSVQRYWKRGDEILTMCDSVWTSNPRIESLNSSITLRINNVSVDDEGQYTCTVNSKPVQSFTFNLQVKDRNTCEAPDKPMNGGFNGNSSSSRVNSYTVNDQIRYFCNRGFQLVGSVNRTCSGPPNKWTPDEPTCEPDYIIRLQESVSAIGNKVTEMESKITTLENRMTTMENITSSIDCRAICKGECQKGFIKLGEQCYFFSTDEKTWPDAMSTCQSLNSTLAYPKNSEENSILKDHVRKNYTNFDWWLGGTDAAVEGTWVWTHNQSPIAYTDWLEGEPNNGASAGTGVADNCLFIGGTWDKVNFQWLDAPCSWKEAFICQGKI